MNYEFTAKRAPTYLHITGIGDHTAENLRGFMTDAYRAALQHGCDSLLMEMNFAGRSLDLGTTYTVIEERSRDGARLRFIACVDVNPEHSPEHAEFAELAANRLGVNVRFFDTVEAARHFLNDYDTRPAWQTPIGSGIPAS